MKRSAWLVTLLLLAAACGDAGAEVTTTTTNTSSTTTTLPFPRLPASTEVPLSVTVDRLQWEGRVTIRTATDEGLRVEGILTTEGAFGAPDAHFVSSSLLTVVVDPDADMVDRAQRTWDATALDGAVWVSDDDGPVREMTLADATDEFELLSTAEGAIIPSGDLLADLMGRSWVTSSVLGRPVMEFIIDEAWMDLYGALFGAALLEQSLPGVDPGSAVLSVDPESGLVLAARLVLAGEEDGQAIDVTLSFQVTAIDDDAIEVITPTD